MLKKRFVKIRIHVIRRIKLETQYNIYIGSYDYVIGIQKKTFFLV